MELGSQVVARRASLMDVPTETKCASIESQILLNSSFIVLKMSSTGMWRSVGR